MTGLRVSDDLVLPIEAVTETIAILAKRGMGKSNAGVVMAEEMWDAGCQWVAIDPKGDWHGIRSSADGEGTGLPVPVFGGRHGDIPLEAGAGELMATLVAERHLTCVLDVSLFSKAEQIRFVTDFAETLFRAVGDEPRPLHLFLEEAEEFLPQRVDARTARMVGAYSKISKQGRTYGLGVTLITQRSASLNKDALSQTDTLVLFRTVSPHDRKAVVAWAEHHDEAKDVSQSLAELEPGESWLLSPGFLGRIDRVRWRRRRTFDSGATPKPGARHLGPTRRATVDLDELRDQMAKLGGAEAAPTGKGDNAEVNRLRQRVAALEAELTAAWAEVRTVEVPALSLDDHVRLAEALRTLREVGLIELVHASRGRGESNEYRLSLPLDGMLVVPTPAAHELEVSRVADSLRGKWKNLRGSTDPAGDDDLRGSSNTAAEPDSDEPAGYLTDTETPPAGYLETALRGSSDPATSPLPRHLSATSPSDEDLRTAVTVTRATDPAPKLRLVHSGTGHGWCLACHASGAYVLAVDEVSGDACKAHLVIDGRAS